MGSRLLAAVVLLMAAVCSPSGAGAAQPADGNLPGGEASAHAAHLAGLMVVGRLRSEYSAKGAADQIVVVDLSSGRLTTLTPPGRVDEDPRLSPDCKRIAFDSESAHNTTGRVGSGICVMGVDGKGVTRLTDVPGNDTDPSWSPDGKRIAFVSHRDGGDAEIYTMDSDGRKQRKLLALPGFDLWTPDWSPDGVHIAFVSRRDGGIETRIMVVRTDGTGLHALTDGSRRDYDPRWSPDGSRIVFSEQWGGNAQIRSVGADGTSLKVVVARPEFGSFAPCWSPDGQEVAFASVAWPAVWRRVGSLPLFGGGILVAPAHGGGHPATVLPSQGWSVAYNSVDWRAPKGH